MARREWRIGLLLGVTVLGSQWRIGRGWAGCRCHVLGQTSEHMASLLTDQACLIHTLLTEANDIAVQRTPWLKLIRTITPKRRHFAAAKAHLTITSKPKLPYHIGKVLTSHPCSTLTTAHL